MKIQNGFTMADVHEFMAGYRERERDLLVERLERISKRLAEVGPKVRVETSEDEQWNAHEILAHIAVVSKFYGVMVHRIAGGQMTDAGIVDSVNLRDVAGRQMAELAPDELVRMAVADQERTIRTLREASPESLLRRARLDDGTTMTAEEIARLPLVSHLEAHTADLERMVSR